MKQSILIEKSKSFALKIIVLAQNLQNANQYILANQILRSGTSIGANVSEAYYASSKADFANKLCISQKEAGETKYWLELLYESKLIEKDVYDELMKEIMDLLRILGKSIITANSN